ncbi:MAG TPA: G1 family glutamic endopeptidase [Acidimicrobiales bacterium]|nr:G1 family glutamic endopeptidase [Acidimicrobiales bacterium]
MPTPTKPCPQANYLWSGYVDTSLAGGQFTSVSANWIQTKATCGQANRGAWALFWVGLDGSRSVTVEQGGTEAQCVNGKPRYSAWWEMYPTNLVQTSFPIAVGDHISASVVYSSASDTYTVTVQDTTSGQSLVVVCWTNASAVNPNMYTVTLDGGPPSGPTAFPVTQTQSGILCSPSNPCQNASAEWVVEAPGDDPSNPGGLYPLAHYLPVTFQSANAVDVSGDSGSISDPAWEHTGYDLTTTSDVHLADVSALKSDGTQFRDVRVHG